MEKGHYLTFSKYSSDDHFIFLGTSKQIAVHFSYLSNIRLHVDLQIVVMSTCQSAATPTKNAEHAINYRGFTQMHYTYM